MLWLYQMVFHPTQGVLSFFFCPGMTGCPYTMLDISYFLVISSLISPLTSPYFLFISSNTTLASYSETRRDDLTATMCEGQNGARQRETKAGRIEGSYKMVYVRWVLPLSNRNVGGTGYTLSNDNRFFLVVFIIISWMLCFC